MRMPFCGAGRRGKSQLPAGWGYTRWRYWLLPRLKAAVVYARISLVCSSLLLSREYRRCQRHCWLLVAGGGGGGGWGGWALLVHHHRNSVPQLLYAHVSSAFPSLPSSLLYLAAIRLPLPSSDIYFDDTQPPVRPLVLRPSTVALNEVLCCLSC